MYAVVKTGGKQYRVAPGETVEVELLKGEIGDQVKLEPVLLVGTEGEEARIGTPTLAEAAVTAEIVEQKLAPKIIVFKKTRRKGYSKRQGHRQPLTKLKIVEIQG